MSKKDQYKEKFIEALKQENLKFTSQVKDSQFLRTFYMEKNIENAKRYYNL